MSQQTSKMPKQISNFAEGEPDMRERLEPPTHLRTATVPALHDTVSLNISDTGLNFMVSLNADGRDVDEQQDSSLTRGETTFMPKRDTHIEMTKPMTFQSPVLIVEDTVELAEVIQATLEAMGIESVYETHGKNGLERLKEINPELVIMDIGLPDITGWKMLDSIKAHYTANKSDMPSIIVVTAYGDPANRLIGKLQNIHSYLLKPFTPDQVEYLVQMVLRGEKPADPNFGGKPSTTTG